MHYVQDQAGAYGLEVSSLIHAAQNKGQCCKI